MTDEPLPQLLFSSSPRSTWLWAPDLDAARQVRAHLDTGGHFWRSAERARQKLPLVTDVEIGVTALEACLSLADLGYTFAWHNDVPGIDRNGWPDTLPGMPAPRPPIRDSPARCTRRQLHAHSSVATPARRCSAADTH